MRRPETVQGFFVSQSHDPSLHRPNHEQWLMDQTRDREFQHHVFKKPRLDANPPQNNNNKNAIFYKTRLCKPFIQGCCTWGIHCKYAHGLQDLRRPQQEVAEKDKSYGDNFGFSAGSTDDREGNGIDLRKWKTKLCHGFERTGYCLYGDKCQYAHGDAELRSLINIEDRMELDSPNFNEKATSRPPLEAAPQIPPTVVQPTCAQQTNQTKKLPRWPTKISLIYGDWPPYMQ